MLPKLILIRGSPATGKSTLAKALAGSLSGKVSLLIYDEFKWVMTYHDDRDEEDFALSEPNYFFALENYLKAGFRVVTECAWTYEQTRKLVELANRYGAHVQQVVLQASKKTVRHLNTLRPMVIPDAQLMSTYDEVYSQIGDEELVVSIDGKSAQDVFVEAQEQLSL